MESSSGSCSCDPTEELVSRLVFVCNICFRCPTNSVETACGHLFCWPCMHRHLQGQAKPCPVCATLLSSDVNVVPMITDYASLMLYLPSSEQVEWNIHEEDLDAISTNMVLDVPQPRALSRSVEKGEKDVLILYMGNKKVRKQVKSLQKRVRRVKRLLRESKREDVDVQVPEGIEKQLRCELIEGLLRRVHRAN